MKILAKETKGTSLEVRSHPTFLETLISKYHFAPVRRQLRSALCEPLSPGQTDRQVVASRHTLNLRTDLQAAKKMLRQSILIIG